MTMITIMSLALLKRARDLIDSLPNDANLNYGIDKALDILDAEIAALEGGCDCWDVHRNLNLDAVTCGCLCHRQVERGKGEAAPAARAEGQIIGLKEAQCFWDADVDKFDEKVNKRIAALERGKGE